MKVLVTGSAGFIGSALCLRLLERGDSIIGVDNLNPYYDVRLKQARLARNKGHSGYVEACLSLEDREGMERLFAAHRPQRRTPDLALNSMRLDEVVDEAQVGARVFHLLGIQVLAESAERLLGSVIGQAVETHSQFMALVIRDNIAW